jgi:hypothetical protein
VDYGKTGTLPWKEIQRVIESEVFGLAPLPDDLKRYAAVSCPHPSCLLVRRFCTIAVGALSSLSVRPCIWLVGTARTTTAVVTASR